jgi:predicted DNA-binding helix-hairpin-helix protein
MKKIYVKSIFDLEKDRKVSNPREWDLIADLILYDLDDNSVYYIFNTSEILELSKRSLRYSLSNNNYMTLALQEAYPISEQNFNELLNTPSRNFYQMSKDELLISLKLEEYTI